MRVFCRSPLIGSAAIQVCLYRLMPIVLLALLTLGGSTSAPGAATSTQARHKERLPHPREMDKGITWKRDPVTGELRAISSGHPPIGHTNSEPTGPVPIHVVTQMVPVTCSVSINGMDVPGLRREDFRVFDNRVEQTISYFDASHEPASVALIIDASPSVLRDSDEMKQAADALIGALSPLDQAAVVDFAAHTYLQLAFTDVRELVRRAVARIDVRDLLGDTGGSNIYEGVYLAAQDLFPGRTGRKSIVLLTDGQDSGLGLTLDPASASVSPGSPNRLTFDDVARILTAEDIQVFAVSTESRPKVMTPEWLVAHKDVDLVTSRARELGIPPYTLYLAELVRRTGGQLYFLRETGAVADTFRQIARKIRAEYTLGYYPSSPSGTSSPVAFNTVGWHQLRVEVAGQSNALVLHRAAYYVSATQ
ncbi:MAG TPA: VWA domain-containing protein [Candidatus Acidoferrales bacterium]|nr:VWA domain-containing protein [Candidatus Acidoferrales bacterium]